jgi:hypothetical protein
MDVALGNDQSAFLFTDLSGVDAHLIWGPEPQKHQTIQENAEDGLNEVLNGSISRFY